MSKPPFHAFTLPTLMELRALSEICTLRLPLREAEHRRVERVREALAAGSELARAVGSHTHCLLVNCQGSHGAGDPAREADALHAALARYSALVGALTQEYPHLIELDETGSMPMLVQAELLRDHPAPPTGIATPLERAV